MYSPKPRHPSIETFLHSARRHKFPKNAVIMNRNIAYSSVFYILKGDVTAVSLEATRDVELNIQSLTQGDFFGVAEYLDHDLKRQVEYCAKSECEIASVTYSILSQLIESDSKILLALAQSEVRAHTSTLKKVGELAHLDVECRIASALLSLTKESTAMTHPQGMQIRVTRSELGRISGCSREMAGRVLNRLIERGLIEASGKTMVIYGVPKRSNL